MNGTTFSENITAEKENILPKRAPKAFSRSNSNQTKVSFLQEELMKQKKLNGELKTRFDNLEQSIISRMADLAYEQKMVKQSSSHDYDKGTTVKNTLLLESHIGDLESDDEGEGNINDSVDSSFFERSELFRNLEKMQIREKELKRKIKRLENEKKESNLIMEGKASELRFDDIDDNNDDEDDDSNDDNIDVEDAKGSVELKKWKHMICPTSGRDYWYNEETDESVWQDPNLSSVENGSKPEFILNSKVEVNSNDGEGERRVGYIFGIHSYPERDGFFYTIQYNDGAIEENVTSENIRQSSSDTFSGDESRGKATFLESEAEILEKARSDSKTESVDIIEEKQNKESVGLMEGQQNKESVDIMEEKHEELIDSLELTNELMLEGPNLSLTSDLELSNTFDEEEVTPKEDET
eukprot:g5060.t1